MNVQQVIEELKNKDVYDLCMLSLNDMMNHILESSEITFDIYFQKQYIKCIDKCDLAYQINKLIRFFEYQHPEYIYIRTCEFLDLIEYLQLYFMQKLESIGLCVLKGITNPKLDLIDVGKFILNDLFFFISRGDDIYIVNQFLVDRYKDIIQQDS